MRVRCVSGVLRAFQLCYASEEEEGKPTRYLVPELLSEFEPEMAEPWDEAPVRLRYRYQVLPPGLLPRFTCAHYPGCLLSRCNIKACGDKQIRAVNPALLRALSLLCTRVCARLARLKKFPGSLNPRRTLFFGRTGNIFTTT